MILQTMLQRLYTSLQKGPSLNARPHNSRQRIDASQLTFFHSGSVDALLPSLFGKNGKFSFAAAVPPFRKPDQPEEEWSDEQKKHAADYEKQTKLINKLQDIAIDAQEYFNDHGDNALFIGYPVISIPNEEEDSRFKKPGILAPVAFIPISLSVKKGRKPSVTIAAAGEGSDLLIPNPALLAWLEQQTGEEIPELFEDETGDDPTRELGEILEFIHKSLSLQKTKEISHDVVLKPIQKIDQLPRKPNLMQSAVLGLFPITNPGLLRDTKWMIENEDSLEGPIQSFLCNEALQAPEESQTAPEPEENLDQSKLVPGTFAEDNFIAPIDPSQARTAASARSSDVLVIHGPPGTGKSQTITNIIGDLLARGQRVLFVCDKRTALDVVKYRLDHVGLGNLCGIIHDPSRDRRNFYMGLRDRLETLSNSEVPANPSRKMAKVNKALEELDTELKRYYSLLHGPVFEEMSFHELVGKWFEYRRSCLGRVNLPDLADISVELVDSKKIDLGEILRRADDANLPENPLFEQLELTLESFVTQGSSRFRKAFAEYEALAAKVDEQSKASLLALVPRSPLKEQASFREELLDVLKKLLQDGENDLIARISQMESSDTQALRTDWEILSNQAEFVEAPLERELVLHFSGNLPRLAQLNEDLAVLEEWDAVKSGFFSFLQFGKKKKVSAALSHYGCSLSDTSLERVRGFCQGLKARWLLSDSLDQVQGVTDELKIRSEDTLRASVKTFNYFSRIWSKVRFDGEDDFLYAAIQGALLRGGDAVSSLCEDLRLSAKRAQEIDALISRLTGDAILNAAATNSFDQELRANGRAVPRCSNWSRFSNTVEDVIRIEETLQSLPGQLGKAVKILAVADCDKDGALNELYATAYRNTIREVINQSPELLHIDSARINAAFDEYGKLLQEKQTTSKRFIEYSWEKRQRDRLVSNSGSRLSTEGTALRQRLFIRGKKALRLRQMIASGEGNPEGDPLFDLCPVWMASPSTVAQILPREKIFDTVIFDEASQCRLEEALPILLRAQRVVIAGDPKQLPPTRFFESAVVESDDTGADTVEELAEQQMSEAEDLLSAALNLDVDEAFLEVHYRSRHEALIEFSNRSFYNSRLQAIPGHPKNKALVTPISVLQVDGLYENRTNRDEALVVVDLVAELLDDKKPPSIGIACFNINQRDLIIESLNERASEDDDFAKRLSQAQQRRGQDSFEGLFVRNLENVQGDERDHIIISTTFGRDSQGKFRRNFGAVSRQGGDKRLNVLITRSRSAVHIVTSIPKEEYMTQMSRSSSGQLTGREQLYAYLKFASDIQKSFDNYQEYLNTVSSTGETECTVHNISSASLLAEGIGRSLADSRNVSSITHWGNEGFCVDVALVHDQKPEDVSIGVLVDFNRFTKTQDPIAWEHFRTNIFQSQGWNLHRIWSPYLSREPENVFEELCQRHKDMGK
ncbi:AAA domain-containing protein [Puniceicoccaceae bacterium K14]|nr:AAA domain-containing protein [Puniceicoccaceae bacterium K14]